jgi:asparagine synthase (glutamine-hydrolysing)
MRANSFTDRPFSGGGYRALRPIPRSEEELVEELDQLRHESVRLQLGSDVPVGVFLSGGIDSSLVTAYAATELSEVHTFSVGFEAADPEWDETGHAAVAAEHLGTRHERVVVTPSDFAARIPELVRAIDQPSADGVNSYFVSGAAAPHVKVALSGQGGDELFAGYNIFRFASRLHELVERMPVLPGAGRIGRKAGSLPASMQHNWYLRGIVGVLPHGDPTLLAAMANPLFGASEIGAAPMPTEPPANGDVVNAISTQLVGGYLANTLLRDTDAMSMSHSLEVRVPIVDPVLAEFALSIQGSQKVAWNNSKALLRAIARRRLPAELLDRPKQGFNFPLADWLRLPGCYRVVSEGLSPESVAEAGLVDPALVARELRRFRSPLPKKTLWLRAQRVWALYVLHEWHQSWRENRLSAPLRSGSS